MGLYQSISTCLSAPGRVDGEQIGPKGNGRRGERTTRGDEREGLMVKGDLHRGIKGSVVQGEGRQGREGRERGGYEQDRGGQGDNGQGNKASK